LLIKQEDKISKNVKVGSLVKFDSNIVRKLMGISPPYESKINYGVGIVTAVRPPKESGEVQAEVYFQTFRKPHLFPTWALFIINE